jgi:hypothetical protein
MEGRSETDSSSGNLNDNWNWCEFWWANPKYFHLFGQLEGVTMHFNSKFKTETDDDKLWRIKSLIWQLE